MSFASAIAVAQKAARAATNSNGSTYAYTRGAISAPVSPGRGRSTFNVDSGQGVFITVEAHDFLIATADLKLANVLTLPQRGDKIVETLGSATYTYEILELNGEPAWRYADEYRQQLRIHAKLIG